MAHAEQEQREATHPRTGHADEMDVERLATVGEALAEIGHDGVRVASMAAQTRSAASGTASARAAFAMRL